MKRGFFICVLGSTLLATSACSQNGAQAQPVATEAVHSTIKANWTVDVSKSEIGFTGVQGGDTFDGSFSSFDAQIKFDPADVGNAEVLVTIDMKSVDAGDSERNEALPGKEWFFVKSFPTASFQTKDIFDLGDNKYKANGTLTLRDISKDISLPFRLDFESNAVTMTGGVSLDRSMFGIGTGMWAQEDWVDHKVDVKIKVVATQKN